MPGQMQETTSRRYNPTLLFTGIALLMNVAIATLVRLPLDDSRHRAVLVAACFDLLITAPVIYYLLVVRSGSRRLSTVWWVIALGLFRTTFLIPRTGPVTPILVGAAEVGLIAFVILRMKRGHAEPQGVLMRAVTWEAQLFHEAFRSTRARRSLPPGARVFTIHQESGFTSLLSVVIGVSFIETGLVHLVVQRWSVIGAWIATALSLYGAVWLFALCRSFTLRPVVLSREMLELRKGLLWSLSVPLAMILTVERIPLSGWRRPPGYLAIAAGSEPKLLLVLSRPVEADGPYGIRRRVTHIGVAVDGSSGFEAALLTAMDR